MEKLSISSSDQSAFRFVGEHNQLDGQYKVGVVGATGAVGRTVIQLLHERQFSISSLHLFASSNSDGKWLDTPFGRFTLQTLRDNRPPHLDFVFMAAGSALSKKWARRLSNRGAVVIDKSSYFRDKAYAPLVVPEVNGESLEQHRGIIANPNCTTIPFVTAIAPLDTLFGVRRATIVSFQSVSGQGRQGLTALLNELEDDDAEPSTFTHRIAYNVIPWIGGKGSDKSGEELKMISEARRILNRPRLSIRPTAVRVPTLIGHGLAVHADFNNPVNIEVAKRALDDAPGVTLLDDLDNDLYPTPLMSTGKNEVLVGRVRRDFGKYGLAFWIVADNLRTGAATNAVKIAEAIIASRA